MWSQLPLGCVLASFFASCGCLIAAWVRLRKSREEFDRLVAEIDLRNREHDDAYLRLEARVEDLADRLVRSSSDRRQLSASNQRLAAENQSLAGGLRPAIDPAAPPPAPAAEESAESVPALFPDLDFGGPQTTVFEQAMETVLALAQEPVEEPSWLFEAAPSEPVPAAVESAEPVPAQVGSAEIVPAAAVSAEAMPAESPQGVEEPMPDWNPIPQRPSNPETAPALPGHAREQAIEVAASGRVRELERALEARDEQWRQHLAAVESLREVTARQSTEVAAVVNRCGELEAMIRQLAEERNAHIEHEAEAARARSARESDLEEELASREEDLRRKSEASQALEAELDATRRRAEAAERRVDETERRVRDARLQAEEIEERSARQAAEEQERLRREQELHQVTAARARELEASLASRDEELRRKSEQWEGIQTELGTSQRRVDAAERLLDELQQRIAQQSQDGEERARREQDLQDLQQSTFARATEFEARLATRDEELRRKTAECDAVQAELASSRRRAEGAERLLEELQQRIAQQTQEGEERLRAREEELRQRGGRIELLQEELAAKSRQLEALEGRSAELEERIQLVSQEEAARLRRDQEIHHGWTSRTAELESNLARRDEDLRQRGTTIERLEKEAAAKSRQVETAEERCGELEQELRRREDREKERALREQTVELAHSTRAAELEGRLARLAEELERRSSSVESLQQDLGVKNQRIQETAERCAELELEMQRRAEQDQARRAQEQALETERSRKIADLERELASRDETVQRLRGEHAHLADRCQGLSDRLDARARDLRLQEQHLAEVQSRAESSEATARRRSEDVQAGETVADELVENRLSALFKRRSAHGAESFSELYLDGLEQGDFDVAMQALLGDPEPLAAASLARLGARWRREHEVWRTTPIGRDVVYLWASGVRLCAGFEKPESALLAVVASHADGSRSVVAIETGDPSSKEAWLSVLQSLVQRGMNVPRLVVGPGASGLWAGIDELGWDCARQFCWTRETDEVLAGLPKKRRSQAEKILRSAAAAETRADAKKLRDRFVKRCGVRCAASGERISADWKQLTSFYAFPEDHWSQLQTTQVVEAPLSAIRLAAAESRSGKPSANVEAVLWKVLSAATKGLRKLSGPQLLPPAESAGDEAARTPARTKARTRTRAA